MNHLHKLRALVATLALTVVAGTALEAQTFTANPNMFIADNASQSTNQVVSGLAGNISSLRVDIRINHTWDADMNIWLVPPGVTVPAAFTGTPPAGVIALAQARGGSGDNFGSGATAPFVYTQFSSATDPLTPGTIDIAVGTAPFTAGVYTPESSTLATFNALYGTATHNGTWTIGIADVATGDTGTLLSWQLAFATSVATASDIEVYEGVGTGGTQFPNPGTVTGLAVGPVATGYDYTIENDSAATANLVLPATPVTFNITVGATAVNVAITQPGSLNLAAGATTGFVVTLNAIGTGGAFTVQVSIASNDPTDNPFVINISGTATVNNPARANPGTGTPTFTGSADAGPFGFAADPGTSVTSSLLIDDADADDVQVVTISPSIAQAGITAAASAAGFGATRSVNFTGTLDANAAPGVYTWTIDIEDDQTPAGTRTITVNITLNNLAPVGTNAAITPTTGTGVDLANAYARTFTQTVTVPSTDLFDVTDANLGQTLTIFSQTRTGGATATTFPFTGQFAIAGSAGNFTVSVSTVGALVATDIGTHEHTLVIQDVAAGNQITVFVTLTVSAQTPPTFTPSAGITLAQGASQTGVDVGDAADGQDPFSALNAAATTVPTGITVSAIAVNGTTGQVTATISVGAGATVGLNSIVFTVTDSLSATGTGSFDVTVTANSLPVITAGPTLTMGTSASQTNRVIANVSDAEDANGSLTVTVLNAPTGVVVSAIVNTAGEVRATITTTSATAGANIVQLQVMDSDGATATANYTVTVSTGGGGGGGGGSDSDGGGCNVSGSSSNLWLALFGLLAVAAMGLRVRRNRA